ncbi:hypothetical protein CLOM_g13281 [Closterium sp. NIES-68]|nr:hypothetical protein CLOM_g13281 [Closterium sp. NIES-68]
MTTPFHRSAAEDIATLLRQRETREAVNRSADGSPPSVWQRLLPEPTDGLDVDSGEREAEQSLDGVMRDSSAKKEREKERAGEGGREGESEDETDRQMERGREREREVNIGHSVVEIDEKTPLLAPLNSGDLVGYGARREGRDGEARVGGMQRSGEARDIMVMERGRGGAGGRGGGVGESGKVSGLDMSGGNAGVVAQKAGHGAGEEEEEDQPQCRICLETDGRDLIAPCKCKGSARFVHRQCLDQWRSVKEGFAFCHCSTCKTRFHLRVCPPPDVRCRHLKFRFFVARDIVLVTLLVQMLVVFFACLVYLVDYFWLDKGFQKAWAMDNPATLYYICAPQACCSSSRLPVFSGPS